MGNPIHRISVDMDKKHKAQGEARLSESVKVSQVHNGEPIKKCEYGFLGRHAALSSIEVFRGSLAVAA